MTIIPQEWHKDFFKNICIFWALLPPLGQKKAIDTLGYPILSFKTGGLVRVWTFEWWKTHTRLYNIDTILIIKVWDVRLQMQRLKSVDPTIPFLFYLTKTGLFIIPPFSDPGAGYRISSYKALPRIIPTFLIMPAPGTLLCRGNLVISNNTRSWRPYLRKNNTRGSYMRKYGM